MKFKLITTNLEILKYYINFLQKGGVLNIEKVIYLPKKKKRITLLKSPHVHKKAQEHFISITYSALILCKNKTAYKYLFLNVPSMLLIKIINLTPTSTNLNLSFIGIEPILLQ